MKNGDMQVWWKSQIPMKSFYVEVKTLQEAVVLLRALADYDIFQFENKVKPDYCNTGGLLIWDDSLDSDEKGECWCDWYDDETGFDFEEYQEEFPKLFDGSL